MIGRNIWRAIVGICFIYIMAHLTYTYLDLKWMPPITDLTFVTESPFAKKKPDGPLVLNDGFLPDNDSNGTSKILTNSNQIFVEAFPVPKIRQKLKIGEKFLEHFKQIVTKLHQQLRANHQFLLFTMINRAYLDLCLNWLCNLYTLSSRSDRNPYNHTGLIRSVIIVALEEKNCQELHKQWPEVTCIALKLENMNVEELNAYNNEILVNSPRFKQFIRTKTLLIAALAEMNIPFVAFESDSVWLRNPMEFFENVTLIDDADLVLSQSSAEDSLIGQRFALNLMVSFGTDGSHKMLKQMQQILDNDETLTDQYQINELCSSQFGGVVCREFRHEDIVEGSWLAKLSENERKVKAKEAGAWPYVVNNNYYKGIQNKIGRQAINGLWFLTPKKVCNFAKAKRSLDRYKRL